MSESLLVLEKEIHDKADHKLKESIENYFDIESNDKIHRIKNRSNKHFKNPSQLMIQVANSGVSLSVHQLVEMMKKRIFDEYKEVYREQEVKDFLSDVKRIKGNGG